MSNTRDFALMQERVKRMLLNGEPPIQGSEWIPTPELQPEPPFVPPPVKPEGAFASVQRMQPEPPLQQEAQQVEQPEVLPVQPRAVQPQPMLPRDASAAAYKQAMLEPLPNRQDYQPSKKRRVLGGILGAFAGISNPRAGYEMASDFVDSPYNRAMQDHDRRVNQAGKLAAFDQSAYQTDIKGRADMSRIAAQQARADADIARGESYGTFEQRGEQELKLVTAKAKAEAENRATETYTLTLNNGSTVHMAGWNSGTGVWTAGNVTIPPDQVKSTIKSGQQALQPRADDPYTTERGAWQAAHPGQVPTPAENDVFRRGLSAVNQSNAAAAHSLRPPVDASGATDIPAFARQVYGNPELYHTVTGQYKRELTAEMERQGMNVPAKLSVQEKNKLIAVDVSLQHAAKLREMLKNPAVARHTGVVAGKITNFLLGKGALPPMSADEGEAVSELKNRLNLFLTQEAAVINPRFSNQLLALVKESSPKMGSFMEVILGSLNAAESSAHMVRDAIKQSQFPQGRGTYKPEGTGNRYRDSLRKRPNE